MGLLIMLFWDLDYGWVCAFFGLAAIVRVSSGVMIDAWSFLRSDVDLGWIQSCIRNFQ